MNHILIVEDEKSVLNLIRLGLSKEGYKCTCAYDGIAAADLLEKNRYDLVLLDIMLPGFDGFALIDYIRPMDIPVIFITAKGSVEDRVKGLRAGAEDYIVKPFDMVELLARVEVVLRRYNKIDSVIEICSVTIDTYSRQVKKDGREIHLTPKEYDLLLLFARNPNRAMYRETIYERVWGEEFLYGSKTVDLHVQRLRKKLDWENHIQAVNKIGYRLEV